MLKLVNEKQNDIAVTEMKDGDLAVITGWTVGKEYNGTVVQRYKDSLIAIGKDSGCSWSMLFNNSYKHRSLWYRLEDCKVRLLEKGETLVVE